ncbi:hypothetical protein ES288_D11G288800v1 [Gossypium darwinii]|uniref:DUF4371 domain-containing protein n=1 Tax=Gossypium darwinii TaxID=34276 RepID=A0A5D2AQY0_GOSDA|nr:hypothetical protein ES288_D11G288800v1 [Gossypium darwinii]
MFGINLKWDVLQCQLAEHVRWIIEKLTLSWVNDDSMCGDGFIRERSFDLVHVKDTTSLALEKAIHEVLLLHCLNMDDIHGQEYDGASNMRGECNGLQALFTKKCYSYLSIVLYLTDIINLAAFSNKWHEQLRDTESSHIAKLIDTSELETGKGKNQVDTLQRLGDTRWGSHLASLNSLIRMFDSVCVVLQDIIKSGNLTQRSEVDGIYDAMISIKFVFILHFMIEMIRITDDLCEALQYKPQDILNAMQLEVKLFCKDHEIEVPNLSAPYKVGRGRSCIQRENLTIEHHYRLDIFIVGIDSLLTKMNSPFNDEVVELLILSSTLDPHDNYKAFSVEDIYKLMNYFYPDDYTEQEKLHMKIQLEHFQLYVHQSTELQKASIVIELSQVLAKTNKSSIYHHLDRIIRLMLTLPMSTTTTERAFSAMKNEDKASQQNGG